MEIKNLPPKLRELAIKESQRQHPERNEDTIMSLTVGGSFIWRDSPQGEHFWNNINEGNIPEEYLQKNEIINNYSIF